MIRVAALAAALAAALVAGSEAPAKVEGRLFGLLGTGSGQFVVELDPATLAPREGRRLRVGPESATPWALDPSRHTLAVADGNRLRLIDLASFRRAGVIRIGWEPQPSGAVWLRRDRILLFRHDYQRYELAVVDVPLRRIVSRRELGPASVVRSAQTRSEVVLLRALTSAIGPASLLVVNSAGETREIPLPRIQAGLDVDTALTPPVATANRPALALDEKRRVAYVVASGGLVAEVSLDGDQVRYHAARGRFAKLVSGWHRHALFLDGKLFVTGSNSKVWTDANGKPAMRTDPAGLELIDPATWQSRRLANDVSSVGWWPGGLLATGGVWTSEDRSNGGTGLVVYSFEGTQRYRVLDGKRIWVNAVYGGKAYVQAEPEELVRVIDLASGRVIGTRQGRIPSLLLEQNPPVW